MLAATLATLIVPILLDLVLHRAGVQRRLFAYAAPDTFYYLTVARNVGQHGRFAFDGEHLSNGFHPLWQVLVSLPYALRLPRADTAWVLAYLLVMALGLQAAALTFLARALRRADGSLSWLFVSLPVGAYALLASPVWLSRTAKELAQQNGMEGAQPVYGTWWSYVNGMETSLVLFFFGLVLWLAKRPRPLDRPVSLGLALIGLTFARLDHALIAAPILLGLSLHHLATSPKGMGRWRAPGVAFAAFTAPLLVYLLVNKRVFGSAMPVSGRLKSSYPYVTTDGFRYLVERVNHTISGEPMWLDESWRVLQIAIPVLFAVLTPLAVTRIRIRRGRVVVTWAGPDVRMSQVLLLLAAGVAALGAYDFLFVYFYGAGHWYLPVSSVFTSLVVLLVAERIRDAWARRKAVAAGSPFTTIRLATTGLVTTALCGAAFVPLHRSENYHARFASFVVDVAPLVRERFAGEDFKIIDCDDGIVGWALGFPTMSGTGLVLDVEAMKARTSKEGVLPLAIERGYRYVAAVVYVDGAGPHSEGPEAIKQWVLKSSPYHQLGDVKKYRWSVAYRAPKRDFTILKVEAP